MNRYVWFLIVVAFSAFAGCQKEHEFSEERPLAIEVTWVRSLYHAENIRERLNDKGLPAYVVATDDTVEGGQWYRILVGAERDSSELAKLTEELRTKHRLDSLNVLDFRHTKDNLAETTLDEARSKEKRKIEAESPKVPQPVYDVITKFPESKMFFVEQMYVFNAPANPAEETMFSGVADMSMDLPRGIDTGLLLNACSAFAEVIYRDNIYQDRVTLDILKLKPDHGLTRQADASALSPGAFDRTPGDGLSDHFAQRILDTGEYATEEQTDIAVDAFRKLQGRKVVIEPRTGYLRTYLVLVDEAAEYVIFCQSTEKSEEELLAILQQVGQGEGMLGYEEFYNTFFTLPSQPLGDDVFLCFYIDKLGWDYAAQKGYAAWAKEYVGHWAAHAVFYNIPQRGLWTYGLFDLLTAETVAHSEELYAKEESDTKERVRVYGVDGFFISRWHLDWNRGELYRQPREVNFPKDRYVCMVDNHGRTRLNKDELIARAERFQFQKGGYTPDTPNVTDAGR